MDGISIAAESDPQSQFSRRGWIKTFVLGTVGSACGGAADTVLADLTSGTPAVLRLKLSNFPALQSVGGSVQLSFSQIIAPMTINRASTNVFHTFDSICTHAGCTIGKYIAANGYMYCSCHGSRFDIEGRALPGSPAFDDLNPFATSFDPAAGVVSVTIPGLALGSGTLSVHSNTGGTLRLKFVIPVTAFASYEVRHQTGLDGTFTVVPFATTAAGVASQNVLTPNSSGTRTIYVDSTNSRGFYVIALRLAPF
jgi:nitrite reductase/ring-hydroxylating ferredoxin subunit